MKRDLAVECGLGLEHGQEHFGKTTERVRTTVWPASVQVSGQRVSMEAGSIGARHRPRYRPLSCRTAFRTPFLAKCQVLRDGPFGSNLKSSEYTLTGVRLIQLQNIGDGYWKNDNAAYISQEKFATLRRHGARPGDIALAKMADPIARACIIPTLERQYLVVADCIKLTVNQNQFEPSFIVRAINFHKFRTQAEQVGIGTTRQRVNLSQVRRLSISVPTLPEQRRIAEILDTLDRTIDSTQRIIEKLQATRQGLLHDLLTRGLDEHGQLRNPARNPELFKETELGLLPREWEIKGLGQHLAAGGGYFQTGPFGSQLHAREYVSDGIPVVMPQDMVNGHISEQFIARITPERANSLGRHKLQVNDVLFSRRGDLSRCTVITEREVGWLCGTGCLLARFPTSTLLGDWLALVYTHDFGQRQVAARAVGSTMVNLNTGLLSDLLLPFPPLDEQRSIIARLQGHDGRIRHETQHLAKLQALKRGLMDDLLTGRVRVPSHASGVEDGDASHPVRPAAQVAVPEDFAIIPPIAAVAPQHAMYRAAAGAETQALSEWTRKLVVAVQGQQVATYSPDALDAALPELLSLTIDRQGLLRVPEVMAKAGIRFMLLPHPSQSKANGAAFYLDEPRRTQPVVGLSLRYPYLDVFWFNLLHELAHIRLGHEPVPEESLEEYDTISPDEVAANRWAQDLLIPPAEWQAFFAQHPASDPQLFHLARHIGRHVSVVAGRYGHETKNWKRVNPPKLRPTVTTELMTLSRMLTGEP